MSAFTPLLIGLIVSAPLVVLTAWLYLWLQRRRYSDAARLKVLRILLSCVTGLTAVYAIWRLASSGTSAGSATSSLSLPGALLLAYVSIFFQIYECRRRLRGR